jgi:perosamine synthetase
MRSQFLPFHLPEIGEEEIQSVSESLRSGWVTTGPKVKKFEEEFAGYLGAGNAIAVNSCTAALHLGLEAVGVGEGDEVIVPTMTFASTAGVVLHLHAKPVFIDCKCDTLNMDVDQIERAITPKTKAIIPVHFSGHPCEMDRIMEISKNYNLKVIEDAAHALPTRYKGKVVGTIGDITCFSFYATKTITTGEGGMITTEDSDYAEQMRVMSLHGISKDAWKRYESSGSWHYEIFSPGYKYNMTDISAAIGIHQLKKIDHFAKVRSQYAEMYSEGFRDIEEIRCPVVRPGSEHSWHLYVIQLNGKKLKPNRNEIIEILKSENIGTSVHFMPLHLHPYYRDEFGYVPEDFPVASSVFESIISLTIFPKMTEADVQYVIKTLRKIIQCNRL